MRNFSDCEQRRSDSKIVFQENKSKITFLNPKKKEILDVKIDGCVFVDNETLRCDYLLILNTETEDTEVEIYVELKGSDISHAVKQLESTIRLMSEDVLNMKKLCFVVSTRVPKQTTSIQKLQTYFKKNYNASFRVKNIQDTFDISTLIK